MGSVNNFAYVCIIFYLNYSSNYYIETEISKIILLNFTDRLVPKINQKKNTQFINRILFTKKIISNASFERAMNTYFNS